MNCFTFASTVLAAALLAPGLSYSQVSCTREGLQAAADLYIAAQAKGDTDGLPLAKGLAYIENFKTTNINDGLIKKAMKIDHHRSLVDTSTCQTFTEVIVTDKANPYVLGTRLRVNHALIAEIEMLWTTTGYWLFNADNYLKYSSTEDWGVIPAARRDTRDTLVSAANAYRSEMLWTTTGYWLFNADNYLKYSSTEDWGVIPAARRDTRDTLVSAANAYLDAFL